MLHITEKQNCCGCSACYAICPKHCILMQPDQEGFLYPEIDESRCIDCGKCEKVCPLLRAPLTQKQPEAYACINTNREVRRKSSSGGVFTLLAEEIIDRQGVVIGAVFNDTFKVIHDAAENKTDITKFRGSKYVQSVLKDIFPRTKSYLLQGKTVLFSGTSCQIAGLCAYLGKPYPHLICVDMICHGVPSPLVWERYRAKKTAGKKLTRVCFRNKNLGWKRFGLSFSYQDGSEDHASFLEDIFLRGFLKDIYSRPSCYDCHFKNAQICSDITLADFWGVEHFLPELDDNKGTSLILTNTAAGRQLFSTIAKKLRWRPVPLDQAIKCNPSATRTARRSPRREAFFSALPETTDIEQLITLHLTPQFTEKMLVLMQNRTLEWAIFGTGAEEKALYYLLKNKISLIAFYDGRPAKQGGQLVSLPVTAPPPVTEKPVPTVIIVSSHDKSFITEQLETLRYQYERDFYFVGDLIIF